MLLEEAGGLSHVRASVGVNASWLSASGKVLVIWLARNSEEYQVTIMLVCKHKFEFIYQRERVRRYFSVMRLP